MPSNLGSPQGPRPSSGLTRPGSAGCTSMCWRTGRAVIARDRGAQVGAAAAAVAAGGDIEQLARVLVQALRVAAGGARNRIDRTDQRRRGAGSAEHHPARTSPADRAVDRDAGVGIGNRRDVGDDASRAAGVGLPAETRDGKNHTVNGIAMSMNTLFHHPLSTASAVCSNQRMNDSITKMPKATRSSHSKQLMSVPLSNAA